MRLTEIDFNDTLPINGYGPGFFRVGGKVHQGGVLILPGGIASWDGYADLAAVLEQADAIDVLLVGTGAEIAHIPEQMRETVEAAGVGIEVMASPPACRTFNVLLSEGRRIGAALLPV